VPVHKFCYFGTFAVAWTLTDLTVRNAAGVGVAQGCSTRTFLGLEEAPHVEAVDLVWPISGP
jgi:hypothetical protein